MTHTVMQEAQTITWTEQQWLIQSVASQTAQTRALHQRLDAAATALSGLLQTGRGRRCSQTPAALADAVAHILTQHQVVGLLDTTQTSQAQTRSKRAWGPRPAQEVTTYQLGLTVRRNVDAIAQAEAHLGWRVYVSNQSAESLPMAAALLAYREEYVIERGFARLKGIPLSLRPWYVSRDDHATGLLRLLSLGLRVLTLVEHTIRAQVQQEDTPVAGLVAGQPKRTTKRPTTEAVLRAFRQITLTIIHLPGQVIHHLTPLSDLQQLLLALARLDATCYGRLIPHSLEPPGK